MIPGELLTVKVALAANAELLGPGLLRDQALLDSAYSSFSYYGSDIEQIASIYRGLIKNHPFADGNKRTASVVLKVLANAAGVSLADEFAEQLALTVAAGQYEVEEVASMIETGKVAETRPTRD